MSERKLVIRSHKYSGETSVVSVRLPKDMLAEIDSIAEKTGRTRSEIIVLSMEFALENIETK
ncbi:MAG: ribbon-helix-helix domain-containing protein [Lachnospiraceae bacterium]|nr:ribbon-helix-helix domain-containing protein [Lachnospiraceae bacterium]